MPYTPIPISSDVDVSKEYDVNSIDDAIFAAVRRCEQVIQNDTVADPRFMQVMSDILFGMIDTHGSIRMLLRQIEGGTGIAADAIILARAQVESLFLVAWLLEAPANHALVYARDGWFTFLRRIVYEECECANIFRQLSFLRNTGDALLTNWAAALEISSTDVTSTRNWIKSGGPKKCRPSFLGTVPTPHEAISHITNSALKTVLDRMYHIEYRYLCAFPHVGQLAGFTRKALRERGCSGKSSSAWKNWDSTILVEPSLGNSHLSMLLVATRLTENNLSDADLAASVIKAWEPFAAYSLSGKFAWENWSSKALGIIGP